MVIYLWMWIWISIVIYLGFLVYTIQNIAMENIRQKIYFYGPCSIAMLLSRYAFISLVIRCYIECDMDLSGFCLPEGTLKYLQGQPTDVIFRWSPPVGASESPLSSKPPHFWGEEFLVGRTAREVSAEVEHTWVDHSQNLAWILEYWCK